MESYLKFLEEKVDKIIRDMATIYILKKEVKQIKEESEVFKTLVFGLKSPANLSSWISTKSVNKNKEKNDYSSYNKINVHQDVARNGSILERLSNL